MEWNYNKKTISIWFKQLPLNKILKVEVDDWYGQIAHHYATQDDKNSFIIKGVCKENFSGEDFISGDPLIINQFDEVDLSLWKKGFFNAWEFCRDKPDINTKNPIVIHFKRSKPKLLEIVKIEQEV